MSTVLTSLTKKPHHIRNVIFLAHVDHGKSTLRDVLITNNLYVEPSNDNHNDYKGEDTNVIRSDVSPLLFKLPADSSFPQYADGPDFLINLLTPPGNVDFSYDFVGDIRACDGAVFIVDMIEGICVNTETCLRTALTENLIPVLAINKLDRGFLELQLSSEEMYQSFLRTLENTNVIISTYYNQSRGDISIHPEKLNVVFMSALGRWGFTLKQFALMYADKFGVDEDKMIQKLWGDNYYDADAKKWKTTAVSSTGKTLSRAFCKFVLDPISQIIHAAMNGQQDKLERMLKAIKVTLRSDESQLTGKPLMKIIMSKWLPLSTAVLEMVVNHLPSPVQAQKYRTEMLYTGPQDDITAEAMRQCNPQGPLEIYVFKMTPTLEKGRFFALGRIFSGSIHAGQTVRILDPGPYQPGCYDPSSKTGVHINKPIKKIMLPVGRRGLEVESVGAGNMCLLYGVDQYILKRATITTDETSYPLISPLHFKPVPPTRYTVEPENPADLPKLMKGLKYLQAYDLMVQVTIEETGEFFVSGESELHIEVSIRDIEDLFMEGGKIKLSGPVIVYKETVISLSSQICMAKSPNKHNRLYMTAEPLQDDLPEALEKSELNTFTRQDKLVADFGWKEEDVKNIWCFGQQENLANIMVNSTNSIPYVGEIKDSVCAAFQWAIKEGVLAEEGVRGVRMNLVDAVLHADVIHRGGGQIIPTARRAFYAAMLTAQPRLMEPMLMVEIMCPQEALGGVYSTMNKRRGIIFDEVPRSGTPLITVKGYLPAENAAGFTPDLRSNTNGQAFPQMSLSHYQVIPDDPLEIGTRANDIVKAIRKRKGLLEGVPPLTRFLDTL